MKTSDSESYKYGAISSNINRDKMASTVLLPTDVHVGHRERLREKYIKGGLDSFQPHEVLELVLMQTITRKDVNPIAHDLITTFGSLANVLEADVYALCSVKGVGERTALNIHMYLDVLRQYKISKMGHTIVLDSLDKIGEYCCALDFAKPYEVFYVICLNRSMTVINTLLLSEGGGDEVVLYLDKTIHKIMCTKASSVVLTHSHPGGITAPSDNDKLVTFKLIQALKMVGVRLVDHIIVAGDDYCSMKELKCM
ncbi:MAG: DNA repair protein RadC [Clostridiales bacterium]|nr:DNA repair protein RadC [Clostridiales bacterium]